MQAYFDANGAGDRVAKYCGAHMARILSQEPDYAKGAYVKALDRAFIHADDAILADRAMQDEPSGCTATAVLLAPQGERVFCVSVEPTMFSWLTKSQSIGKCGRFENRYWYSRPCQAPFVRPQTAKRGGKEPHLHGRWFRRLWSCEWCDVPGVKC